MRAKAATESLRDQLGKNTSTLRTMSEAVEFEFGVGREKHLRSSELILQISITAAALAKLVWNQVAVLHDEHDIDLFADPGLVEMHRKLADHVNVMAEAIARKTGFPSESRPALPAPSLWNSERNGEYTRSTIARYEDLQMPRRGGDANALRIERLVGGGTKLSITLRFLERARSYSHGSTRLDLGWQPDHAQAEHQLSGLIVLDRRGP